MELEKWAKDWNFTKEDIQVVNKRMKRCSAPLVIRKMQITIIGRVYYTYIRMADIKNTSNTKMCWQASGETWGFKML